MQIDFDLPYFFSPATSLAEKKEAKEAINRAEDALQAIYLKARKTAPAVITSNAGGSLVRFNLPGMFTVAAGYMHNARCLRVLMECLTALNMIYLRQNPLTPALYDMGVHYNRTQVWDSIPALIKRGYGDCKTLTAAKCAEDRLAGQDSEPVHRFLVRKDGGLDYHILVLNEDNSFTDPSKVLGMGADENAKFRM